jgi:serine/threonine protein kinase/peroxiredoxin
LTAVSGRLAEFTERDCEVLGVSTDSLDSHDLWIATPRTQGGLGGLSFPLASDERGEICEAYGVFIPRRRLALRGLFIIDPNGVVQYQLTHNLNVGRSTEEVLRVLDALQTGGLCPAEWTAGQENLDPVRTLGPDSLLGPYRIEAILGTGSFGTVFRAWDTTLERRVALKVLSAQAIAEQSQPSATATRAAAVLSEARAAAGLNHPNICVVHSVDPGELAPMIVMEYVDGKALESLLEGERLSPEVAVSYARQIALGMAEAHRQGVVHGDLKPANIMVTSAGFIKIMDFGLARRQTSENGQAGSANGDGPQGMSGTPSYMAPEQVRGLPASAMTDVYSLGLILYEMATGKRAVQEGNFLETLRQIEQMDGERLARDASEPFATILRQTLVRHPPEQRLSMNQIVEMLAR